MIEQKVPPICIDLGLADYYEGFMGCFNRVKGKKRLKFIEEDHLRLHRDRVNHIHLDGTEDSFHNE